MITSESTRAEVWTDRLVPLLLHGLNDSDVPYKPDRRAHELWRHLQVCGTACWMDSGDLAALTERWDPQFSAVTTNNALLAKEVGDGAFDDLIVMAAGCCAELPTEDRIALTGLFVNVRHALRIAGRMGVPVSVELHTDLAHDVAGSIEMARLIHAVAPEHFLIKLPATVAGLLAARQLEQEGIRVNCTLGFSARQNAIAAAFAGVSYVNVFVGRIDGFMADNQIDVDGPVALCAALASQRAVRETHERYGAKARQIMASLRSPEQVERLAGCDVMTIPLTVVEQAEERVAVDTISDHSLDDPELRLGPLAAELNIDELVVLNDRTLVFIANILARPPATVEDFTREARAAGLGDCFPPWSRQQLITVARGGKIPRLIDWHSDIAQRRIGIDALLQVAGLLDFAVAQQAIDSRIASLL